MNPIRVTDEQIIAALKRTMGKVYLAADQINCHPKTIYRRAKQSRAVRDGIVLARERAIDTAECALQKAVLGGEAWAVCFTLKTLGKARGYIERQELTGANGKELGQQKEQIPFEKMPLPLRLQFIQWIDQERAAENK